MLGELESVAVIPAAMTTSCPAETDMQPFSTSSTDIGPHYMDITSISQAEKGTQCPEHVLTVDHSYIKQTVSHRDVGIQWEDHSMCDHDYIRQTPLAQDSTTYEHAETPEHHSEHIVFAPQATSTPIKTTHTDSFISASDDDSSHSTDMADPSYDPGHFDESSSEGMDSEPEDVGLQERMFLVSEIKINALFSRCRMCGNPVIHTEKSTTGTLLTVTFACSAGCNGVWHSQPLIRRMPLGNLLVAGGILFTGGQYTKFNEFASLLHLPFISESTFYGIQGSYLFPVVEMKFMEEQDALLSILSEQPVWLLADGQCDSPGHNAKYLTYTTMEEETELIIASKVVCVAEVANSNAMEVEGLHRCIEEIEAHGVKIDGVATDRHPQIKYYMKCTRPQIEHQFEVFHTVKGVTKELSRSSNTRDTQDIAPWIKSISNHMWWSCATCNGDAQVRKQ